MGDTGTLRKPAYSCCVTDQPQEEAIVVPVVWVGGDDLPTLTVNQFLVQVDGDEIYLTIGTMTPPALIGDTPEDLQAQALKIGYVPIRTVAKLSLSPRRLRELRGLLERGIEMNEKGARAT